MTCLMAVGTQRRGITITEVVCVMAIISGLIGLLMPAIQTVRESARQTVCSNNLRSLGIASLNYETAFQKLPPGNLGFADVIICNNDIIKRWHYDPEFEFYWKKAQHSSALALLLPYMDENTLYDTLPSTFTSRVLYKDCFESPPYSWIGEWSTVDDAMRTNISAFYCPSDNLEHDVSSQKGISMYIGAQPVYITERGVEIDGFMAAITSEHAGFSSSNYIGCSGAYSGGRTTNYKFTPYRGALGCRNPIRVAEIRDGQSQTILFGESLGALSNGKRNGAFCWLFGSIGRGRGALPWGKLEHPADSDVVLFGDSKFSYIVGFGSKHPFTINTVFADASSHRINRSIDLQVWYEVCGIQDGGMQFTESTVGGN